MIGAFSIPSHVLSLTTIVVFSSLEADLTRSAAVTKDFCEGETFRARCSYDEVIMIDSATYGRMRLDRCVKLNMGYLGCHANVLSIADEKCSGRRSCDISIPDSDFEQIRPCLELKSYLHISYHCTKVLTADSNDCRIGKYNRPNLAHPPSSGQLASILAHETGCGSLEKPWIIEVPHGQQINLTLIDFTTRHSNLPPTADGSPQGGDGGRATATGCVMYAKVLEKSAEGDGDENAVICGRQGRERHVYTSRSHVVRVVMEIEGVNTNHFLIGYQAIGCPDPVLHADQYFHREDDGDLVIGCKYSADRWRLTCRHDNQWQGEATANCTSSNAISSEVIDASKEQRTPNGVLVAVLCVMVILLLLLTILIAVLLYKRYRRQQNAPFSEDQTSTVAKSKKSEAESITYTVNDSNYDTKSRKSQRYGRHVDRRHPVYDSPFSSDDFRTTKNPTRDRGSEYEKVETCHTIGQFSHIWNTPLPKIPGHS